MYQATGGGLTTPYSAQPISGGTSPDFRHFGMTPTDFLHRVLSDIHTQMPDYDSIINRLMAPLREGNEAKLKALGAQTDFQKKLAQENARIQQEQMAQVHKRAVKTIVNGLAGRGMLQSGDKSYYVDFENDTYGRSTSLAQNQLLAFLVQLENQLSNAALDATNSENSGLLSAQQYAQQNYSPNTHYDPWAPTTGTPRTGGGYA